MHRAQFTKSGNAVWMSHLDLMRVLQRAFRRAGLLLKHSQGFTPHPALSLALPLSVGVSSCCELMDFELAEGQEIAPEELLQRLNAVLPAGVQINSVYNDGVKLKYLTYLQAEITLEYDAGIPAGCVSALQELLARDEIPVEKRTKSGAVVLQNIREMIRHTQISRLDDNTLTLTAVVCAQNPSLNPAQIVKAISEQLPEFAPDFSRISRTALLDTEGQVFH